jgi:hypothetical protein
MSKGISLLLLLCLVSCMGSKQSTTESESKSRFASNSTGNKDGYGGGSNEEMTGEENGGIEIAGNTSNNTQPPKFEGYESGSAYQNYKVVFKGLKDQKISISEVHLKGNKSNDGKQPLFSNSWYTDGNISSFFDIDNEDDYTLFFDADYTFFLNELRIWARANDSSKTSYPYGFEIYADDHGTWKKLYVGENLNQDRANFWVNNGMTSFTITNRTCESPLVLMPDGECGRFPIYCSDIAYELAESGQKTCEIKIDGSTVYCAGAPFKMACDAAYDSLCTTFGSFMSDAGTYLFEIYFDGTKSLDKNCMGTEYQQNNNDVDI